jgi:hypothetical protein
VGPAQPSAARKDLAKEYRIEAFDISISERKALCPAGKTSTKEVAFSGAPLWSVLAKFFVQIALCSFSEKAVA